MKIYTVYLKDNAHSIEEAVFIPENEFSIQAFIFNIFWLVYKRMWFVAILFFLLVSILPKLFPILSLENQWSLVPQLFSLLLGFYANDLHRITLERQGFKLFDIVCAKNIDKARYKFINRNLALISQ